MAREQTVTVFCKVSSFALRWCAEQVSLWCVNDLRLEGRPGWCCRRLCGCGWRGGWVLLFTEHIQSSGTSSPISSVTGRLLVLVVGVQKHTAPFARWVSRSYIWSCHLPPHNHPAGCRWRSCTRRRFGSRAAIRRKRDQYTKVVHRLSCTHVE